MSATETPARKATFTETELRESVKKVGKKDMKWHRAQQARMQAEMMLQSQSLRLIHAVLIDILDELRKKK